MNDKELADAIDKILGKDHALFSVTSIWADDFVRDWRVAGALMEKVYSRRTFVSKIPMPDIRCVGFNCESLPRAIIEACVSALTEHSKTE